MGTEAPTPIVIPILGVPSKTPSPECGKRGRRKRTVTRPVRTLPYKAVADLEITSGQSAARCEASASCRNTHEDVLPRAASDNMRRDLLRDRILKDGRSVERTLRSLEREVLLELASRVVYDVLHARVAQLDRATHRREVREHFTGTLGGDEWPLGRFTLLLDTDAWCVIPGSRACPSCPRR